MAGIFNYRFKENYGNPTCVVKFWFGSKYFIWKCLHLKQSCDQVFRDLNRKILNGGKEGDLFFNVVKHQKRTRVMFATVEVLFESTDLAAILAFDHEELSRSSADKDCLNTSFDQYIPKWLEKATSNKAIQGTISTSDDMIVETEAEIKPEAVKIATDSKSTELLSGKIDAIRAAKAKFNGK